MRVCIDIEANGLEDVTQIWCIVCKDIDTGEYHIFREDSLDDFRSFQNKITYWVGHNLLGYDLPLLVRFGLARPFDGDNSNYIDTLIVSKLVNFSREQGHSIEAYGKEFGLEKGTFSDFSKYSLEMEDYCVRDVDICHRIYNLFLPVISDPAWSASILLEQRFQGVVNDLHTNGFSFNSARATSLLSKVSNDLALLDVDILTAFPPRLKLIREITPKRTKHGTLSKTDFRWLPSGDLSEYNGGPFCRLSMVEFNPASHKQVIDVLNSAGWKPIDRTKTYIEYERELNRKRQFDICSQEDYNGSIIKITHYKKYGWKINENNLSTLPSDCPPAAKLLAKRILLESRRRTLTEWISLVKDGRIHGKFLGIGAWSHRMAHQNPNTANIPNEYDIQGKKKLLGKEMRSLWCAPKGRLLVGVDAEGIQLRIFAHYIDDAEFTRALVEGRKDDKTDPHSLNQRILGSACKSRAAAKRFIYALLLGAGLGKLAEILDCSREEAQRALDNILKRYTGFAYLKQTVIQKDAERGYFVGLDGRKVSIPGGDQGYRAHLAMSGYLQNGEAVVLKKAALIWHDKLSDVRDKWLFVNMVHDEYQTECINDVNLALRIAKTQADAIRIAGEELKLRCPLAGSYWNDDLKDFTIANNWALTH